MFLIKINYLSKNKKILFNNLLNFIKRNLRFINNFINKQLDTALNDFNFNLDNKFHFLIFKFKKINVLF